MSSDSPVEQLQPGAELTKEPKSEGLPFPVVGIGASAGGLEAFTELLGALPPNPGMAILFVLHLDPHHKSHLSEVLSKTTKMPVVEAREGMPVEINHVYLIPHDKNMGLADGHIALTPRSAVRSHQMPIDHLFRSLATGQKSRTIGVILSGGGSDGSLGFQAIKAEGGITFVQDERTARQVSMPRSALSDGNVDYTLPPHEIVCSFCASFNIPITVMGTGTCPVPRTPCMRSSTFCVPERGLISAITSGPQSGVASCGAWRCAARSSWSRIFRSCARIHPSYTASTRIS
jgi:chemotaxis response regulator CheB